MSKLSRIDELAVPPVVGRFYLVPTVRGVWGSKDADWPVQGELHEDHKFFGFPWRHYHLDRRFIRVDWADDAIARPLTITDRVNSEGLPDPVWRPRKCVSSGQFFPTTPAPVGAMQDALAGAMCRSNAQGWVCPHRNLPLGSVRPDKRGIITCPMHGLRIDAATGVVLDAVELRRRCLSPEDAVQQERVERMAAEFQAAETVS